MEEFFKSVKMNEARFLNLLEKLIGESKYLQNSPPQGLIPQENLASNHVLDVLRPFSTENGGPLTVERVEFVKGRGNVIITYPGTTDKVIYILAICTMQRRICSMQNMFHNLYCLSADLLFCGFPS